MRIRSLTLDRFGAFADRTISFGSGLTLVMGANEAGKSTALAALSNLLWGVPPTSRYAFLHARQSLMLHATLELPEEDAAVNVVRRDTGLTDLGTGGAVTTPWVTSPADTRARWRQSFGLSHDELRQGGAELCRGSGDLAELVFTARSGQAVRHLLEQIDREADALFKQHRGNKGVAVRLAYNAYLDAVTRVRESTAGGHVVRAVRDDLDRADGDVAAAGKALAGSRQKAILIERRTQAADHARAVAALDRELEELLAEGMVLDEEQLARWTALNDRYVTAGEALDGLGPKVDEVSRQRAEVSEDGDLLADEEAITRLHLAHEARQADVARAQELFGQAAANEREAAHEIERLTGPLGEQSVAQVLATWHVSAEREVQVAGQAAAIAEVTLDVDRTAAVLATADAQLDEVSADRHDLDLDAVRAVRDVLTTIQEAGSITSLLLKAVDLLAAERKQCDEALQRAGVSPQRGVVEPVPSVHEVEVARLAVTAARSAAGLANAALDREHQTAEAAQRRRDETDVADLPLPSDLPVARAARDEALDEATQAWSSGQSFEQSGHWLSRAREAALAADVVADRLARGADAAARRAELDSAVATGKAAVADAGETVEAAADADEQATALWGDLWATSGLLPALAQGATVQAQLAEARDAHTRANAQQTRIEQIKPLAAAQASALQAALDRAGRPRPSSDLDSLISAAEQFISDADADREARATIKQRQKDLRRAGDAHATAISAHADALVAWVDLLVAAGAPRDLDPAAWAERQSVIRAASTAYELSTQRQQEAAVLAANHASFLGDVRTLGERHGDSRPDESAVIEELSQRVKRARAAGVEARRLDEQSNSLGAESATAKADSESATAALERLASETFAGDLTSLARAAERGRAAAPLKARRSQLRDLVRASAPDENLDALIHELAATEPHDLDQALTDARAVASDAEAELATAAQTRGELSQRERDLTNVVGAADLNARAQEQLAVVAQHAERFLVADIQRKLLRQELAAYESRHASPLLEVAGAMLERLTEGRFVALRATGSGDSRGLLVVGADGDERTPDQLSEGTADQVFLALRLAGIASLQAERRAQGAPTLPVVFDDVLMAFDDNRAKAALTLMSELAEQWQIIVMTHHEHVLHLMTTVPAGITTVVTLAGPAEMAPAGTPESVRAMARAATVPVETAAVAEPRQPRSGAGVDPSMVRAWARENGYEVGERGRIPVQVIEAYNDAHR
jgi:uncharacterized protein YhaN